MPDHSHRRTFSEEAARGRTGLLSEMVGFLRQNKKWWLLPALIVILLLSLVILLGSSGAGPFIYALF